MIKAIVFDCFGVLVTDALEAILVELREEDPETATAIVGYVYQSNKGIISREQMAERIGALLDITGEEYFKRLANAEVRNTGLFEIIVELRKKYKTAMLSNVGKAGIDSRFSKSELETYFDEVVVSGEIGFAKPEPQAYEITADRLSVRLDECVFVDDRAEYCDGAVAVGMKAIQFKDNQQFKKDLTQIIAK